MKYDLDLFGVFIPSLLLWSVVAYGLVRILGRIMGRAGFYRHVWHPALFDFALYTSLLTGLVLLSKEVLS